MKMILSYIIVFILGISITIGAYQYSAKDMVYTPSNTSWNVHNVKDAIDYLKSNSIGSFGEPYILSYKGNRGNIALSKNVDKGKYLVIVSWAEGATNSAAYNTEDETEIGTVSCSNECEIESVSSKYLVKNSSGTVSGRYPYVQNSMFIKQIEVKEDATTISYQLTLSAASSYANSAILEIIPM